MSRRERISKRPLLQRKLPTECLSCGSENPWVIHKVAFSAPFRTTVHDVSAEAYQCRHCDAITTSTEQTAAISAMVREAHSKWLAEKFKKQQKQCGCSLREIQAKTGISFATLGRISSASHLVDESTENWLFDELEQLVRKQRERIWMEMDVVSDIGKDQLTTVQVQANQTKTYNRFLDRSTKSPLVSCMKDFSDGLSANQKNFELTSQYA